MGGHAGGRVKGQGKVGVWAKVRWVFSHEPGLKGCWTHWESWVCVRT